MIVFVLGVPGSGKSYWGVNFCYDTFKNQKSNQFGKNTHFYTNIDQFSFDAFNHGLAHNLDFDDLKFFLPDLDFLDGRVYLNFKAKGKYNNFALDKLLLKTDNSVYDFAGTIKNLDEPSKLYLDITSNKSEIDPIDTKLIIPGLPVPDYSHLGKIKADFHFVGEPVDFDADIDICHLREMFQARVL